MAKMTEGRHEPMGARVNCAVLPQHAGGQSLRTQKMRKARFRKTVEAKNGEATWGAMARERKLTTKIGEPLYPSRQIFDITWGCFGGTGKVIGRKRGEMGKTWDVLTEKRGENAQNGGVLGYRKVVRNCSRAVGEKRRAEGLRRGREFTMKPGERQKNPRSHERTGRKGERRCGKRRAECAVN